MNLISEVVLNTIEQLGIVNSRYYGQENLPLPSILGSEQTPGPPTLLSSYVMYSHPHSTFLGDWAENFTPPSAREITN